MKHAVSALLVFLFFYFATSQAAEDPPVDPQCRALMSQATERLANDEVLLEDVERLVEETIAAPEGSGLTVPFLTELVVPSFYARDETALAEARTHVRAHLLPRLQAVRQDLKDMKTQMSVSDTLSWLGERYDRTTDLAEKTAVLAQMMSVFSISVEHHYMNYIASTSGSRELKLAMYRALTQIFKNDPTWQGPLDRAMGRMKPRRLF